MDDERQNKPENQEIIPPIPAPEVPEPEYPAPKTNGLAIASLILGILGMCTCVTAPIGLALGIVAMIQINRNPQKMAGMGLAIAGTVLSGLAVLFVPILAAILFPVFARAHGAAQKAACISNVKQICIATDMYCRDWDDKYPMAENWNDALRDYVKRDRVFVCPAEGEGVNPPGYGMNRLLGGLSREVAVDPANTVAFFDSIPGKNQAGGPELLSSPPRHREGQVMGYADGHAQFVPLSQINTARWTPGGQ